VAGNGIATALAYGGPLLMDAVSDRTEFAMPPSISVEMARSFKVKAASTGQPTRSSIAQKTKIRG
jgi:hypothetical protein